MGAIALLTIFTLTTLSAQHQTLFNSARLVGAFGGPITEYGINNGLATSAGGGGGLVFSKYFLGAYGMASADFNQIINQGQLSRLDLAHGGAWLGVTHQPWRLLHLYGSARIGWGGLDVQVTNDDWDDLDAVFVFTPELGAELNITSWFRLAGAVGYRWVQGANKDLGYSNEDFSGAVGVLTMRFGWFGWRRDQHSSTTF